MLKREELIEDCDLENIIELLGIPIQRKGRYVDILCPKHIGTFGSCKVDLRKKSCRCFRCNETFTPFDLVMETKGCTYYEAFTFVAEATGRPEDYILQDKPLKKEEKIILTKEDYDVLGLNSIHFSYVSAISPLNDENGNLQREGEVYVKRKQKNMSLIELKEKSPFLFRMIVAARICTIKKEKKEIFDWVGEGSFENWECIKALERIEKKARSKEVRRVNQRKRSTKKAKINHNR